MAEVDLGFYEAVETATIRDFHEVERRREVAAEEGDGKVPGLGGGEHSAIHLAG